MRTMTLDIFQSTTIAAMMTAAAMTAGTVFAQPYHPAGPYRPGQASSPVFIAEAAPTARTTPPNVVRQEEPVPPVAGQAAPVKEEKKSSSFFSWFSRKPKPDENVPEDDGVDRVVAMNVERSYTEKDYVASVTQPQGTAAKDQYLLGMQAERQGRYAAAMQSYQNFIRLNKRQTQNGVLAAPYHRLAVIAWKQQNNPRNAETYFRYAIKYAQGANFLIISGDFAGFFMEQGDFEQAEVLLHNGLLQDHDNQRLLVHLARCKARQERPVEAMRHLTKVYGKDQAYQELAVMYRQQGNDLMARGIEEKRERYLASVPRPNDAYYAARQTPQPMNAPPVLSHPRGMGHPNAVYPVPNLGPESQGAGSQTAQLLTNPVWEAAPPSMTSQPGSPFPAPATAPPFYPGYGERPNIGEQPIPTTVIPVQREGVVQTTYMPTLAPNGAPGVVPAAPSLTPPLDTRSSGGVFPVYPSYPSSNRMPPYHVQY